MVARNINCIMAGFPCQGFSVMGHRLGFDDERSILGLEIFRLMRECRGRIDVVILENVPSPQIASELPRHLPKGYAIKECLVSGENTKGYVLRRRWFAIIYRQDKLTALKSALPRVYPTPRCISEPKRWTLRVPGSFPADYLKKFKCVGNTVNPVCIQTALVHMLQGTPLPVYKGADKVVIDFKGFHKAGRFWPSPKTTLSTTDNLNNRNSRTLDTCLRFHKSTVEYCKLHKLDSRQIIPAV